MVMNSFPSPEISSDRLDLREYGADDLGLASELVPPGRAGSAAARVPVHHQ